MVAWWSGAAAGLALMAGGLTVPAVPAASADAAEARAGARAAAVRITRFLGEQRLPHMMNFQGTIVGGLSGIDRDPRTGAWYFISDDRDRYDPARFYRGRLTFDRLTGAFLDARLTGVTTLRQPDGTPYPGYGKPDAADPETIRVDRWGGGLLWGHEGDRPDARHPDTPLSQLFVRRAARDGRHLTELPLPDNLRLTSTDRGPRRNFGFEGLTTTRRLVTAAVEGPRHEDGEPPTVTRGAPVRFTVWDRSGRVRGQVGRVRGQYAYPLDALPAAPVPSTGHTDTGVSEILAIDDHRYLALERSWIEGVGYKVRLYEVDLRGATDVRGRDGLATGGPYRAATKRLVMDLDRAPGTVQNLESLAWGPRLATGECTLVIGSDDNFSADEVTQFLAYATRGCPRP